MNDGAFSHESRELESQSTPQIALRWLNMAKVRLISTTASTTVDLIGRPATNPAKRWEWSGFEFLRPHKEFQWDSRIWVHESPISVELLDKHC
jgi:hypothetical protein